MSLLVPSDMCAVAVNCCPKPVPMDMEGGATCMEETVGWPDELFEPPPAAHPVNVATSSNTPAHNTFFMSSPVSSFFSGGITSGGSATILTGFVLGQYQLRKRNITVVTTMGNR